MAARKNKKKKSSKPKTSGRKKANSTKRVNRAKKLTAKKPTSKRAARTKTQKNQARRRTRRIEGPDYPVIASGSRSGEQAGDLEGLSRRESADSESVTELLDEGNVFEADAVAGVEEADNADEQEVHTHEVPEDDVPGEYLDEN